MKSAKISWCFIIISPFLIIYFVLFALQLGEPASIQAFNETLYSMSQSYPKNNSLPGTTKNNNFSTLIFSNPFYLSNDTLMLGKIPLEKSDTINREAQFFVKRGIINTSMVTYNVGYYIKDSKKNGSNSNSIPLRIDPKTETGPNYANGSGIFLTENGGIIEWDAFDQIINNSAGKVPYAGMSFFLPTVNRKYELSLLKNRLGSYKFSIDYDTTPFLSAYTTNYDTSTQRTIWFWPHTH